MKQDVTVVGRCLLLSSLLSSLAFGTLGIVFSECRSLVLFASLRQIAPPPVTLQARPSLTRPLPPLAVNQLSFFGLTLQELRRLLFGLD